MDSIQTTPDKAKRQVALLGKMLLYSINHLTDEERQIYDSLVEELASVAKTPKEFRSTQKSAIPTQGASSSYAYQSAGNNRSIPGAVPPPVQTAPKDYSTAPQNKKLQGSKPERVVQWFVECWDKQDFKQEYFCLSDNFKQGKRSQQSLEEYVNDRYKRFANRHLTGPISKQVVDVSAPVTDGDLASVQVAERHSGKDEDIILYRTYQLIFEKTAWRILDFKTNQKRVRRRV
ncbi:MAG: hypothetical protein H6752_17450 [Candidatus Omnitrophica bacterium]|nr:hypothetical protein [Candidatus Omnitrophota bacterium]